MGLNRSEKAVVVEEIGARVADAQSIILAEYRGLEVEAITVLRRKARESGVYLRVLKNTLARRAVAGTPFEVLADQMSGPLIYGVSDDPVAAAEIALGIADASRQTDGLTDVRVGLALGPVLEREGDVFGSTVNLASRATAIAYPGSVVVSPELRAVLTEQGEYDFRGLRPRTLKNIGRVALSVLRRAEDRPATIRNVIEDRRKQIREAVAERLSTIGVDLPGTEAEPAPGGDAPTGADARDDEDTGPDADPADPDA